MVCSTVQPSLRQVLRLAERQHGLVTFEQLTLLGLSRRAIQHRVATGRLHRVRRGVFAVGVPRLSVRGHWMAAVLACGTGAVLSHGDAAALWSLRPPTAGAIHVSVPASRNPREPGVRVHRRVRVVAAEHADIPVTSVVATLVDIAAGGLGRTELERAIAEADRLDLIDPETLRVALDDHGGQPGVRPLRGLLDHHTFTLTQSELERLFLPIARRAGLPQPLTQQHVNGFRVDFWWPDLGLVVETDGLRYHRAPSRQAADLRRDQAHTAAGMTTLRFAHYQVKFEPNYVEDTLRGVARRLRSGE